MGRLLIFILSSFSLLLAVGLSTPAEGVFPVCQKGVEGHSEAKNGFLQAGYAAQLPGLTPKACELDGSGSDAAVLLDLKEKKPDLVFTIGPYATKMVREALPGTWIVYGLVYFPETEGFLSDQKMVGVDSLGPAKEISSVLKAVGKPKGLAIIHSDKISQAVPEIIARLKEQGIDAKGLPVSKPEELEAAIAGLKGQVQAAIFLPDQLTASPEIMRGAANVCVSQGIFPLALTDGLVASGALCAAFYPPDAVGAQAAKVAKDILSGKEFSDRTVKPASASTSCNRGTAEALKVKFTKDFHPETSYE